MKFSLCHWSLCTAFVSWLASATPARAANWPGFRGPNEDGVASAEKPPVFFNASSNLLWKTGVPHGHSSPIIWGDLLFLTGAGDGKLTTLCLNRKTGEKQWEQTVAADKMESVHESNSHATATPVTDGKTVCLYFGSFGLLAYDLEGKELWRKAMSLPKTFNNQGSGSSPILADGKLLFFLQDGDDSQMLAFDPADGHELWKTPLPLHHASWSTPIAWKEDGKDIVGLMCAKRFTAFQVSDGAATWWVDGLSMQACSTPVVAGDKLFLATAGIQGEIANVTPPPDFDEALKKYERDGDKSISFDAIPDTVLFTDRHNSDGQGDMRLKQALSLFGNVKAGEKLNRERWEGIRKQLTQFGTGAYNRTVVMSVRTGGKQNVAGTNVLWKETRGVPEVPSPLVWQGRLYLVRSGGILVCRDVESGKLIYEERLDSPGGYFASPILADGRIYLASDRGMVTVVKAGDSLDVLARNNLGEPIYASPVAVDDTLFIRSSRQMWAFHPVHN